MTTRLETHAVRVGRLQVGGGAPIVVQSMTNTDTADAEATARQCVELAAAGSEMVRITINTEAAAAAVPEVRRRMDDSGYDVPLVGDFHFNGHRLLRDHPACAEAIEKFRINPGTAGHDRNFEAFCAIARDLGKAVRIGVNGGSLDSALVTSEMRANSDRNPPLSSAEIINRCVVASALESVERAQANGLGADRIVVSAKVSSPPDLIVVYRRLAEQTRQPLHLGLTEAGMGVGGLVRSAAAMGVLLADGIGDTVRVSLTPRPGEDRRDEVRAACELLQALGLRSFSPSVTACPGCGRTTSTTFQELAVRVEAHVGQRLAAWREGHPGVERMTLAVMGCVVNGPGEARAADIGISLPGTGEAPRCPVFVDGAQVTTLTGSPDEIARSFLEIVDDYVVRTYPAGEG